MIGNLRVLGLLVVAVFVVSAATTAAAQATEAEFTWGSGAASLTAEQDPSEPSQAFTIRNSLPEPLSFTCNEVSGKATVEGTKTTTATLESLTYGDSGPKGEGLEDTCTGPGGIKPLVKMNGCSYRLHVGTTLKEGSGGETEGTADIVCPEGKEIEITSSGCLVEIPPQEGLGPVYFRTITVGGVEHVTIEARIGHKATHKKAIEYSTGGILCGTHNNETDGTYTGKFTVKRPKEGGAQNLTIVPEGKTEGALSWDQFRDLTVEADPSTPNQIFTILGGALSTTCNEVSGTIGATGTEAKTLEVEAVSLFYADTGLTPTKNLCTTNVAGVNATVRLNGCTYLFHAGTTEGVAADGKSEGTVSIVCTGENKIEVETTGCLIKIGNQTVGPVYYKTVKPGAKEEVTIEAQVGLKPGKEHNKAITYTTSKALCSPGTHTDGTYTGTVTVKGYSKEPHEASNQTDVTVT